MKLNISKDFSLPLDAVTQTFAILAKRGVGKTYTASVMAEEFVRINLPFVVLDPTGAWWGLRSGKDGTPEGGLPVYVIGGAQGIPLEPTAGKVIAEQVATHPSFYILDVSQFESNAAQDRFATDFAERLYRIKEKHREPLHLFIDEADAFAPQRPMRGQERMLGAFEALVRRGRIKGVGVTLITQRAAVLNKNVLTQTECLIVLQTTSPHDQYAIEDWAKRNGTEEERRTLMSSLASLQKGEAWIWSPAWLEVFQRVKIRERETFNSSATPKVGEKKIAMPTMVPVDLDRLSEQIKATIERVKENDPEALKRRIRELERKLAEKKPLVDESAVAKAEERGRSTTAAQIKRMEETIKRRQAVIDNLIEKSIETLKRAIATPTQAIFIPQVKGEIKRDRVIISPASPKRVELPVDDEIKLRKGAQNMLAALVQWSPNGMTEGQMRAHAGLKKSGTYSAYKTDLKRFGFIEDKGGLIYATEAGIKWLGHDIPSPSTTEEVMAVWMPKLRLGAKRMLQILVEHKGEPMTDEELQEESELANSGTYSAYKTELKTAQLIIVDRGMVAANKETLFL